MSIKFKSFHDTAVTKCNNNSVLDGYYTTTDYATKQIEKFITKNNIEYTNIKDIKFSIDSKGNEHILLIYEEN